MVGLGVIDVASVGAAICNTFVFPEEAQRDFDQQVLPTLRRANAVQSDPAQYGGALQEVMEKLRDWISLHFGVQGTTLNLVTLGAF